MCWSPHFDTEVRQWCPQCGSCHDLAEREGSAAFKITKPSYSSGSPRCDTSASFDRWRASICCQAQRIRLVQHSMWLCSRESHPKRRSSAVSAAEVGFPSAVFFLEGVNAVQGLGGEGVNCRVGIGLERGQHCAAGLQFM